MNGIRIARELLKIAREILVTDDEMVGRMKRYADKIARNVIEGSWFNGSKMKQNVIVKKFSVSVKEFITDEESLKSKIKDDEYPVTLCIMVTGDELTDEDKRQLANGGLKRNEMRIGLGNGGAITERGIENLIVQLTTTRDPKKDIEFYGKNQIVSTFKHELMHIFDFILDRYHWEDGDYGIPADGEQEPDYPGRPLGRGRYAPTDEDSMLGNRYTEYYSCRNEMSEYYSDMIDTLNMYIKKTHERPQAVLDRLSECVDDEGKMIDFMHDIENCLGSFSGMLSIFHMLFRKGQKTDEQAKKVREKAIELVRKIRIVKK